MSSRDRMCPAGLSRSWRRAGSLALLAVLSVFPAVQALGQQEEDSAAEDAVWITSIASLTDEGQFVASTADGLLLREAEVVRFEASQPSQLTTLYKHPAAVWQVVTADEGKTIASVDYRGNLVVYDVDSEEPTLHEGAFERWCQSLAVSPKGDLLVAGNEAGKLYVWNLESGEVSKQIELDAHAITDLAFSPDEKQLAATDGAGHVHLLKWPGLEAVGNIEVGDQTAWCVAFTDGGDSLLIGSSDRNLYRCDAKPDAKPESILDGTDWITQLAVTEDGDFAAGEIGGTIRFGGSDALQAESGVWTLHWNGPSQLLVGTRKDGVVTAGRSWTWMTPEAPQSEASDDSENDASDD